ncbi:prefoldin subunit [Methanocaldococcus sp.]
MKEKVKKEMNKEDIKKTIEFIKSLPDDRKIFIEMSGIWVEVTKEEAIKYLSERLADTEGTE